MELGADLADLKVGFAVCNVWKCIINKSVNTTGRKNTGDHTNLTQL